jgi:hypothetical protein
VLEAADIDACLLFAALAADATHADGSTLAAAK